MSIAAALIVAALAPLSDLRVGLEDGIARVVLVCDGPCTAEPTGDGRYALTGVDDELTIDLTDEFDGLGRVTVTREGEGSVLTIETERPPRAVAAGVCAPRSLCFDLDLRREVKSGTDSIATLDAALGRLAAKGPPVTLRSALTSLAGVSLDDEACGGAADSLQDDAWNLEAYRLVAFCRAAAGDLSEADGLLARLESYAADPVTKRARALIRERMGTAGRPAQLAGGAPRR